MPIPLVAGMLVNAGSSIIGGIIGMGSADRAAAAAAAEKRRLEAQLNSLENSRQAIINPYEGVKDVSSLAKNLSGMISNPYANLGVATQASKFQAEQTDIALANTLDTLKETGSSAGGATALANAALKSKQGISANLEEQEAANEKLKAQGQADMEKLKMAEEQRIQAIQVNEAGRTQELQGKGKAFAFEAQEAREQSKINRVAAQLSGATLAEGQANANYTSALTGMIGGVTSAVGDYISASNTNAMPTVNGPQQSAVSSGLSSAGMASPQGASISQFSSNPIIPQASQGSLPSNWGMPAAGTRYK